MLSDIVDNNELINDCHQLDLLSDGSINSFDLAVLVDMVMSGQNWLIILNKMNIK